MEKLLLHEDTCDAKLVSSDKKEFSVHKAVAALASNVLKLHFFAQQQETSVHRIDCKSNALVHVIDFMCKGEDGMPHSWFDRFCDWHQGTEHEAIDDWVDLVVTMFVCAKKLQMAKLIRMILMHNYKLIFTSPEAAELLVPSIQRKSLHVPNAKELQLLAQCCYDVTQTSTHAEENSFLSYGKNGISHFPKFEKDSAFDKRTCLVNASKNGIVVVTCSPCESMNGFCTKTSKQTLNHRVVITHQHEDGSFFFEEEWDDEPADGVAGTGTLYAAKIRKLEHNKCRRRAYYQCHWNDETKHPIWVSQTNAEADQHPVLFRYCLIE